MLKGKTSSIVLLFVVLAIWGVLIYWFVSDMSDDTPIATANPSTTIRTANSSEKETFELLPLEKDPFLGTIKRKVISKSPRQTNKKEAINWPQISYAGMVESTGGKSQVFMINIAGQQQLLSRGDTHNEVLLVRGNQNEITLKYKGQTQVFTR